MMQSRHIVRSVLCCLLCLTVCAVPALAGNEQYSDGFYYWSNGAAVNLSYGSESVNLLNGYFPATFESGEATQLDETHRYFNITGKKYSFSSACKPTWNVPAMYVEVLFPVPAPLSITVSAGSSGCTLYGRLNAVYGSSNNKSTIVNASELYCVYDDNYVPCISGLIVPQGTYDVKRYFGYKYVFPATTETVGATSVDWAMQIVSEFYGMLAFSDPNYAEAIYDEVTVNTGILQEINGTLTNIKMTTSVIQQDVSEIKDGLQDSNSGIWQSFKDSVSGLFVPSSRDLVVVKDGFDRLAQEKLGGAYQTIDLVDNGVQSVVNKFKNPGSSPGVEFPGISVPLGGDVGTVTLAASQTVTIPEQITSVLYPVAGVIIPIVCVIWTIRQCTDMVECFMSGMSYAEFLHRNSDEEDEEV